MACSVAKPRATMDILMWDLSEKDPNWWTSRGSRTSVQMQMSTLIWKGQGRRVLDICIERISLWMFSGFRTYRIPTDVFATTTPHPKTYCLVNDSQRVPGSGANMSILHFTQVFDQLLGPKRNLHRNNQHDKQHFRSLDRPISSKSPSPR